MVYLIDDQSQRFIARRIDMAVHQVLRELPNHGNEEGLTAVLGHALMQQSFSANSMTVKFKYRQLNKQTEEPHVGADGGFLVRVTNANTSVQKIALFQAKLLRGSGPTRQLNMATKHAEKLKTQSVDMLRQTSSSVVMFYTESQIYVVNAEDYSSKSVECDRYPLRQKHRLITLGTYLGKWMPRCTKGDEDKTLVRRVKHIDGFRENISIDVISDKPSIISSEERDEWTES